jgi:hypothetical protein
MLTLPRRVVQGQVAGFVLHIATSKRGVAEVANVGVLEEFRQMVRTHHVLQLLWCTMP